MTDIFENYILPISGIDFIRYIAIYSELSKFNLKPKTIYCASGGCLASYVAMMSSFSNSVENWNFNSEMFIKKITPITPRLMTFILTGSLYHRQNINDFINKNFIPCKLKDVEIITGFFEKGEIINVEEKPETKIVLTTNYSSDTSLLKDVDPSKYIGGNLKIQFPEDEANFDNKKNYLDYLMNFCNSALYKTTNIPFLIEPLGKERSVDFGIIAPSPRLIANANMKKTFYFSPININDNSKENYEAFFHQIILKDIISIEKLFEFKESFSELRDVLNFLLTKIEYCVIAFCDHNFSISVTNFDSFDVKRHIISCKRSIKYIVFFN